MKISVVTPTLDSARFLQACVASLRMQTGPGVEVEHLVADGGSTDGTVELADELGCTVVPVDPGTGIFAVTNLATKASSGELVGYLGSDDVLLPGALQAVARAYRGSDRRWVTGSYLWVDEHFRPLGQIAAPPHWLTPEMHACLGWCWPFHGATYMERTLFDEIGGLDDSYLSAGDYQFLSEAMRREPFTRLPQALVAYRRRGDNLSIVSANGPVRDPSGRAGVRPVEHGATAGLQGTAQGLRERSATRMGLPKAPAPAGGSPRSRPEPQRYTADNASALVDLRSQRRDVRDLPGFGDLPVSKMGDHRLIDPEAPSAALDATEARGHRARDDDPCHLDVAIHDHFLHVVAKARHGSECVLPHGLLGFRARGGQTGRSVDDGVGLEQFVEGVEVSGVSGREQRKTTVSWRSATSECRGADGDPRIDQREESKVRCALSASAPQGNDGAAHDQRERNNHENDEPWHERGGPGGACPPYLVVVAGRERALRVVGVPRHQPRQRRCAHGDDAEIQQAQAQVETEAPCEVPGAELGIGQAYAVPVIR